jgi:hypothetical protein
MTRIEIPNAARGRRPTGRASRFLVYLLLLAIGGAALWTWLTLSWAYSDGTRAGVLQKISRRGWLCRTEEGELAQYVVAGVSPQIWLFSVRNREIGEKLEKLVGERVQLHYTEHPGVPSSCFGDTRYYVDRVTVIDANGNPAILPSAAGSAPSGGAAPATTPAASPPAGATAPAVAPVIPPPPAEPPASTSRP